MNIDECSYGERVDYLRKNKADVTSCAEKTCLKRVQIVSDNHSCQYLRRWQYEKVDHLKIPTLEPLSYILNGQYWSLRLYGVRFS
jgi:hypothetical protein